MALKEWRGTKLLMQAADIANEIWLRHPEDMHNPGGVPTSVQVSGRSGLIHPLLLSAWCGRKSHATGKRNKG